MNKRQKSMVIRRIEKAKTVIAAKRDELREILDDIEAIVETCDRAEEGLDAAISALSEFL